MLSRSETLPRIALLLPDGVGVRNFLAGPFLSCAEGAAETQVLHTLTGDLLKTYDVGKSSSVHWEPVIPFRESARSMTLRYALAYAQMYWAKTMAMRSNLRRPVGGSWRTRAVHRAARILGRVSASPQGIRWLDQQHCRAVAALPEYDHYRELFQRTRPSVLLCSHQRPPTILPPVLAARSLGIPTATCIFSWDNLTSKGRIAAPFDHYLVWSAQMRAELLRYYPDVSSDRAHIVGTPQFDPYADASMHWSREEFFRRVGADPDRPLICYSGGDAGTAPEDPLHVGILMGLIESGEIGGSGGKPQVLVRPSPLDDGARYTEVRAQYPELIYAQPEWVNSEADEWSTYVPLPGDIRFLANLTRHADLNINLASTMTLDFAIHDKPVVNIAFDVADPPLFGAPLIDYYYQFEHYKPVVEIGATRIARSPGELAEHVNSYLADPSLEREERRRLVDLEVGWPVGQSSRRILEVLQEIAGASASERVLVGAG